MECAFCKGELVRKKVSCSVSCNGYHLIIDDVPAWVCQQCEEPLFDEQTVEAIQEILSEVDARLERLTVLTPAA